MRETIGALLYGVLIPLLLVGTGISLANTKDQLDKLQSQAIGNGYAQHCPLDGKFGWVGECEPAHE